MKDFVMTTHEGPYLRHRLYADQAHLFEQDKKVLVFAPKLEIYQKESAADLLVRAEGDEGLIWLDTKDVMFRENVRYRVIPKKYHLTTSRLYYWYQRGETEVPEGTGYVLTTTSGTVEGSGMISREDLTQ